MMNGFTVFKLWVAMNQHFTKKSFDIFKNRGRVRCKYETYLRRPDYLQFERIGAKFEPRDLVLYLASNFMYGNNSAIWDFGPGAANYNLFISRRERIGEVVTNDIKSLDKMNVKINDGISIIRFLTKNQITFETVAVLNLYVDLTSQIRDTPPGVILEPLLLRIDKSKGFIIVPTGVENYIKNRLNNLK